MSDDELTLRISAEYEDVRRALSEIVRRLDRTGADAASAMSKGSRSATQFGAAVSEINRELGRTAAIANSALAASAKSISSAMSMLGITASGAVGTVGAASAKAVESTAEGMKHLGMLGMTVKGSGSEMKKAGEAAASSMDTGAKSAAKLGAAVSSSMLKLTAVTAVLSTAASAVGSVRREFGKVDKWAKSARALEIPVADMVALDLAAQKAGVQADLFTTAMGKLSAKLYEAQKPGSELARELREIGLQAGKLAEMPVSDAMFEIGGALADVEDSSKKARIAQMLFEESGWRLLPMLQAGRGGLNAFRTESSRLSGQLSDEDAAAIEKINDKWADATAAFDGFARKIAVESGPISGFFADMLKNTSQLASRLTDALGSEIPAALDDARESLSQFESQIDGAFSSLRKFSLDGSRQITDTTKSADALLLAARLLRQDLAMLGEFVPLHEMRDGEMALTDWAQRAVDLGVDLDQLAQVINASDPAVAKLGGTAAYTADLMALLSQNIGGIPEKARQAAADLSALEASIAGTMETAADALTGAAESGLISGGSDAQTDPKDDPRVSYEDEVQALISELRKKAQDEERTRDATMRQQWADSWEYRARTVGSALHALSGLMDTESRKMFEVGKAAAIGAAIADTFAAANVALKSAPPPINFGLAAAVTAAGIANVQKIANTSMGKGGGAAGAAAASQPAAPPAQETVQRSAVNVTLQGDRFSRQQVRGLIDAIGDAAGDNMTMSIR